MTFSLRTFFSHGITAVTIMLLLNACSDNDQKDPAKKSSARRAGQLVATAPATYQDIATTITRTGSLNVRLKVKIFNQEEGKIRQINYYPGDRFKKNNTLIQLDDSLLTAELDKAIATRKQAELDLQRTSTLVKKGLAANDAKMRDVTALKVASAEEALLRTRLNYTVIRAPFDGIVSERLVEVGDIAPRYTHLLTIINPDTLITRVNVSELMIPLLKKGDQASIVIDALDSKPVRGTIQRIFPTINTSSRQGIIEIRLNRIPDGARAGQLCRVTLTSARKRYLMIPFSALRRDQKGEFVFIIKKKKAAKQYVRTGLRHGNKIAINQGLTAKTGVITKGFLGLIPGKKVTVAKQAK